MIRLLLDKVVCTAETLCESDLCCLELRHKVSALCMLYKIYSNEAYPLCSQLTLPVPVHTTYAAVAAHGCVLALPRVKTVQFRRTFVPATVHLRNVLPHVVGDGIYRFKRGVNAALCVG